MRHVSSFRLSPSAPDTSRPLTRANPTEAPSQSSASATKTNTRMTKMRSRKFRLSAIRRSRNWASGSRGRTRNIASSASTSAAAATSCRLICWSRPNACTACRLCKAGKVAARASKCGSAPWNRGSLSTWRRLRRGDRFRNWSLSSFPTRPQLGRRSQRLSLRTGTLSRTPAQQRKPSSTWSLKRKTARAEWTNPPRATEQKPIHRSLTHAPFRRVVWSHIDAIITFLIANDDLRKCNPVVSYSSSELLLCVVKSTSVEEWCTRTFCMQRCFNQHDVHDQHTSYHAITALHLHLTRRDLPSLTLL